MPSSIFANFYRKAKSPIIDEEAIDAVTRFGSLFLTRLCPETFSNSLHRGIN